MRALPAIAAFSLAALACQSCGNVEFDDERATSPSPGGNGRGGTAPSLVQVAGARATMGGATSAQAGAADAADAGAANAGAANAGAAGESVQAPSFPCKAPSPAPWQPIGTLPYRTLCEMAPHPLRPRSLLAKNSHGWFTSDDEGTSWCELSSSPQPVGAWGPAVKTSLRLRVSPAYPQKLFVRGNGAYVADFNGQQPGEITWRTLGWDVEVDPRDPRRIYSANSNGIYLSTDGEHFEPIPQLSSPAPYLMDIALDPREAGVMYGLDSYGLPWRSRDDGESWSALRTPSGMSDLFTLDTVPPALFVASEQADWTLRSLDQGDSFANYPAAGGRLFPRDASGSELLAIRNADEVQLSTDAGKSWQAIDLHGDLPCGTPLFDADTPGRLLMPTQTALVEIQDHQVASRRPSHLLADGALLDEMGAKAASDDRHLAAVGHGLLFLSEDGGSSFEPKKLDLPIERAIFDHGSPSTLFVFAVPNANSHEIRYSSDFGQTFEALPFTGYESLQFDDLAPGTLYASTPSGSFASGVGACWFSRSQDRGASWQCIWPPKNEVPELCGGRFPVAYNRCSRVTFASDPRDSKILFVLSSGELPARIGKSTDGGKNWTRIGPVLASGPGTVASWALSPSKPDRILVAASDGPAIWLSDDGGASFAKQTDDTDDAHTLLVGVESGNTSAYYGVRDDLTSKRLARSSDNGATWSPIPGLDDCADFYQYLQPARGPQTLYVQVCGKWLKTTTGGE